MSNNIEFLISQIKRVEKKNRVRTFLVIFIIASIAVASVLYLSKIISEKSIYTENKVEAQNQLDKGRIKEVEESTEMKVRKQLAKFKIKKMAGDYIGLDSLFADTLLRYYTFQNTPKAIIIKEEIRYAKKFPNAIAKIDTTFLKVETDELGNTSILSKSSFCRSKDNCKETIEEVKMNKEYKIFYARSFLFEDKRK